MNLTDETSKAEQKFIEVEGCDTVVLSCLQKYQSNAVIVEASLSAVRNLSRSTTEIPDHLISTGTCRLIVSCIEQHNADVGVVEQGLWSIVNLASDYTWAQQFIDFEGHCTVSSCLQKYQSNAVIVRATLAAVRNLSQSNTEIPDNFVSSATCSLIFSCMKRHEMDIAVVTDGLWSIVNLTSDKTKAQQVSMITKVEACDMVLSWLQNLQWNPSLVRPWLAPVRNVSSNVSF